MAYKPAYIWNGTSFDQIGNQAVASLDDYALLSPVVSQTITNTTLTSPTVNTPTVSGGTFNSPTVNTPTTTVSYNQQTGTAYTLALSDRDKIVELSNASAISLTIPLNSSVAFPVGSSVTIVQTGAGQVTVSGAGGVTVNSNPGLKLSGQWATAVLVKRATDTWLMMGNTAT